VEALMQVKRADDLSAVRDSPAVTSLLLTGRL
jgi:hypothetical protein